MIQDIAPHIYHNPYTPRAPRAGDAIIICRAGRILLRETADGIVYPSPDSLSGPLQYLFAVDDTAFYLWQGEDLEPYEEYAYQPGNFFRTALPRHLAFAGITALQLAGWYSSNRFCGRCGSPLVPGTVERSLVCPDCHKVLYPILCPSVIVAVTRGDQLLLTRYSANHSAFRHYALVAGYTEIGESVEDTVRREVLEEVGLPVQHLRYYKSQPWSFSGSLLLGFFCEADPDAEIVMDREELCEATWFDRADLPVREDTASLTMEMIRLFKAGKEPKISAAYTDVSSQ